MWGMIFERIWYLSHAHKEYVSELAIQWNSRKDKNLGMHFRLEKR